MIKDYDVIYFLEKINIVFKNRDDVWCVFQRSKNDKMRKKEENFSF